MPKRRDPAAILAQHIDACLPGIEVVDIARGVTAVATDAQRERAAHDRHVHHGAQGFTGPGGVTDRTEVRSDTGLEVAQTGSLEHIADDPGFGVRPASGALWTPQHFEALEIIGHEVKWQGAGISPWTAAADCRIVEVRHHRGGLRERTETAKGHKGLPRRSGGRGVHARDIWGVVDQLLELLRRKSLTA